MAHLEGAYEQMNERLGSMELRFDSRFDALDRKIEAKADAESVDRRFDAVDQRFDVVDRRFDAMDRKFTAGFIAVMSSNAAIFAAIIGAILTFHR